MNTFLIVIAVWTVIAIFAGWVLAQCIDYGTALSPSEQAEQDKKELLLQENSKQYGGFWYSQKDKS